jgi:threonine/homoserine/homoserine lactone efflux protein
MQVNALDAVLKGILVGLFMAISVGPTLFVMIRYSLSFSYKSGLAFVLGVSVSDIMYVTLANLAASWIEYLRPYERNLAIGGGVVLMAIGLSGLLKRHKPVRPATTTPVIAGGHYFKIALSGYLVNTLNPALLFSWLGAVTITAHKSVPYRIIMFATCLGLILGLDLVKVFLAEKIKRSLTARRIVYVQRFSALCIFLTGVVLLLSTVLGHGGTEGAEKKGMEKILSEQYSGTIEGGLASA